MNQQEISNQYKTKLHQQILKVFHKLNMNLHNNILGPKIYTNYQRVALIVLFTRSRKALRDFCSELVESKWPRWLGLQELPSKSTLQRWIKKFDLSLLRSLLFSTIKDENPKFMAIDATGIDSWQRSRHYERRVRQCGVHDFHTPYVKADLLIDTKTKLVFDFVLRSKPRHDVLGAETIFKRLKYVPDEIFGDKGYDSEHLHELVVQKGALFYAPVRDFKVKRPKGKHRKRCLKGNPRYGKRNIVESVNRSLKVKLRSLRSKLHFMKKREFAWHIITYNLELLSKQALFYLWWLLRATSFGTEPFKQNIYKLFFSF